jgi:hypothetical protein
MEYLGTLDTSYLKTYSIYQACILTAKIRINACPLLTAGDQLDYAPHAMVNIKSDRYVHASARAQQVPRIIRAALSAPLKNNLAPLSYRRTVL